MLPVIPDVSTWSVAAVSCSAALVASPSIVAAGLAGKVGAAALVATPTLLAAGMAAVRLLAFRRRPIVRRTAGAVLIAMATVGLARIPMLHDALVRGWSCIS